METVISSNLNLPKVASGKVREIFDADPHLLMVSTDRISVYDVVLPTPIPHKGEVLTGLSVFWFELLADVCPNHLVSYRASEIGYSDSEIVGRTMLVRRAEMLPIEAVVRGYLSGSGWSDYKATGEVCGVKLPAAMRESDRLESPIFTPATKATSGHDENIATAEAAAIVGDAGLVREVERLSIEIYERGRTYCAERGVILADTKLEFGLVDGELTLCDEVLTPDSSRYWSQTDWQPGATPMSFDKQFVRDFAASTGWDRTDPGPSLPAEVVSQTTARYLDAYRLVVGTDLESFLEKARS